MPSYSELPAATSVGTADLLAVSQGGVLKAAPASLLPIGTVVPSSSPITAAGGTAARTLAARFADTVNVLDFGADPTGAADSAPAFNAAIASVASGAAVRVFAPRGAYLLNSAVTANGRTVAVTMDDGADVAFGSPGYLGVARVDATQGERRVLVTNGGYFGFNAADNSGVSIDMQARTNSENLAATVHDERYTDENAYTIAGGSLDVLHQRIATHYDLFDASASLEFSVLNGPIYDELSRDTLGAVGSVQGVEIDVVNNAPEVGWSDLDSAGVPAAGFAVDPSGGNAPGYGGHIRYAFGTAGGVTGGATTLNNRWWTYPAIFGTPNMAPTGAGGSITIGATNGLGAAYGPVTVTVGGTGAANDWATAINAAAITGVAAAVSTWGGTIARLVIYNTAANSLGSLTLGGAALPALGLTAATYFTLRGKTAVAFGGTNISGAGGAVFSVCGVSVTVASPGTTAAVAASINATAIPGVTAAVNRIGRLVVAANMGAQQLAAPLWSGAVTGGLVLAGGGLAAVGLPAGTFYPPAPPLGFATAWSEVSPASVANGSSISINGTTVAISGTLSALVTAINAAAIGGIHAMLAPSGLQIGIRQTTGGSLTMHDVAGHALDALGIVAAGATVTFQPGGYSAGSMNGFFAAPDSIAPGGRGFFAGGSSQSDPSVWAHTPFEARGSFARGVRLDQATFGNGAAIVMGTGHALAWGTAAEGQSTLAAPAGVLTFNGTPVPVTSAQLLAALNAAAPSFPTSLPSASGQIWNNGGVLCIS